MASALQLTAINTISNGHGIAVASTMTNAISSFQLLNSVKYVANIFTNITTANAAISSNLLPIVNNLGSGAYYGQWLLDFYPTGVTPVCSGTVYVYGNTAATSSLSHTLSNQANFAFTNGVAGFANLFQTCNGYALNNLDTAASAGILQNKTYAQSGIGYTGPADLATGGIGSNGALLANVMANWGTMYDIANIGSFSDPYVFGQNLLNQGLGNYGNLVGQFSSVGLNVGDITAPPTATTTTTTAPSTTVISTSVGAVSIPTVATKTTTATSAGLSTDVIAQIYQSVTDANLAAIVSATGISTVDSVDKITTLNDYLNFNKVISPNLITRLANIGITDFASLSAYLQKSVGKGSFTSWAQMSSFFASINSPVFSNNTQTTSSNSPVLSSAVASSILSSLPSGSGPLGNPIMIDFLGTTSGIPYAANIATMISTYSNIASGVESALNTLDSAVANYVFVSRASTTAVSTAVAAVNTQLGYLGNSSQVWLAQQAYSSIVSGLGKEVANITKSGASNGALNSSGLNSFAQGFVGAATDTILANSSQVIMPLVTADSYGDTLKAAIAETANSSLFASVGLTLDNDPKPVSAIAQAQSQNVPLSTYLKQNQ